MPYDNCPFCTSDNLKEKSGKIQCLDCLAEYEIDARTECIFANTDTLRQPLKGTVCPHCGLLQEMGFDKCRLCGTPIGHCRQP